ncbi:MAG: hypothetical protein JWO86_9003 [Myxococcaceae bacterium]|nr:hypothetical protein [Myxococcaceae bacterium]
MADRYARRLVAGERRTATAGGALVRSAPGRRGIVEHVEHAEHAEHAEYA